MRWQLQGVSYIVPERHELWSTNGFKVDGHFYPPYVNSAIYVIARLLSQLLPTLWPILVEFRSATSEIRKRKKSIAVAKITCACSACCGLRQICSLEFMSPGDLGLSALDLGVIVFVIWFGQMTIATGNKKHEDIKQSSKSLLNKNTGLYTSVFILGIYRELSLIHIWRCRRRG